MVDESVLALSVRPDSEDRPDSGEEAAGLNAGRRL